MIIIDCIQMYLDEKQKILDRQSSPKIQSENRINRQGQYPKNTCMTVPFHYEGYSHKPNPIRFYWSAYETRKVNSHVYVC
jgi:hypothetical protein